MSSNCSIEDQEIAAGLAGDRDGVGGRVGEVEADEIDPRRHDVGGVHVLEVHDRLDHRQFVGVEDALLPGDVEDGLEFLLGEGLAGRPEQVGEAPADEIEREAQGREQPLGELEGRSVEPHEDGRVEQAEVLGTDLAEEDQQERDGGDGDGFRVGRGPDFRDGVADVGQRDVDQRVADEDGGQQPRGRGQQRAQAFRGGRVLFPDAPQLDGIDGEIGRFGAGKKGRTGQQGQKNAEQEHRGHGCAARRPESQLPSGFTFRHLKQCV